MWAKLKEIWCKWSTEGIKAPFIFDATTGKPSITLLFPYITFAIAVLSITALHFKADLLVATLTALGFWVASVVLYMLRRISKAKFDLDDKSIELDSGDSDDSDEGSKSDTPQG